MKKIMKQNWKAFTFMLAIPFVITSVYILFIQEEPVKEKSPQGIHIETEYEKFVHELGEYKSMNRDSVNLNIESLNSQWEDASPFEKDRIKTQLIHAKYRLTILNLKDNNANRKARSELQRLKSIKLSIPLPLYIDHYESPKDLFYGFFLDDNGLHVSQSPREHYSANGLLARDVATSGRKLPMFAPDLYNKELEWDIEAVDDREGTGKSLILTSSDKDVQIFVGHVHSFNGRTHARTGEMIGISGGCGDADEGISTGCHIHSIYKLYDKYKSEYVPAVYSFDPMDWHRSLKKPKPLPDPNYIVKKQKTTKISKKDSSNLPKTLAPDAQIYKDVAKEFNIDWRMVSAIHCSETMSRRSKTCTRHTSSPLSSAGAKGCTQFLDDTWEKYGTGNVHNCADSLRATAKYLSANYHKAKKEGYSNDDAIAHAFRRYNNAAWYVDEAFVVMRSLTK